MNETASADSRNEVPSVTSVAVAPATLIKLPPAGGPTACEIQFTVSNRLLADMRLLESVSALRFAPLALLKAIVAAVWQIPTMHS